MKKYILLLCVLYNSCFSQGVTVVLTGTTVVASYTNSTNVLLWEGNSFLNGVHRFDLVCDSVLQSVSYNLALTYTNNALSGSTIANITGGSVSGTDYMLRTARVAADLAATTYNVKSKKNIVGFYELVNNINIYTSTSLSTTPVVIVDSTYNQLLRCVQNYVQRGYRVVINTCTPATGVYNNTLYETIRQNASNKTDTTTINGYLRSDFSTSISSTNLYTSPLFKWRNVILADVGNNSNFGQAGQASNTTYYVDGIHPSALMKVQLSTIYYAPAINYWYGF
jgi:hypothetical protein